MKKIKQHGYSRYETVCHKCKCQFTYGLEDIEVGNIVTCPECGLSIIHFSSDYIGTSKIKDKDLKG